MTKNLKLLTKSLMDALKKLDIEYIFGYQVVRDAIFDALYD